MTMLEQTHSTILGCHDCVLWAGCLAPIPGSGPADARVMAVGEGPGAVEDDLGIPFAGPSGKMLRQMIKEANIPEPYFTNIVKCRPPGNRDPRPDEINACLHYLDEQIAAIDPKVIITVGRYAMAQFLPDEGIMKVHGTPRIVHGRVILPIIHTAAALRQAGLRPLIASDLRLVARLLDTPLESRPGAKLTVL